MYCNSCGSQVPEGTKFCPNCGAALATAPAAEAAPQYATPHYADEPQAPSVQFQPTSHVTSQRTQQPPSAQQPVPPQGAAFTQVPPAQPYGQAQGQSYGQQQYQQPYGARGTSMDGAPYGAVTPGINLFGINIPWSHPMTPAAVNLAQFPQPQPPAPVVGMPREQVVLFAEQSGFKMKWYKFLSSVGLILGGLLLISQGFGFITGTQYSALGTSASSIYSYYSGLRVLDMIYGLCVVAFGVGLFLVRKFMIAFSKRAPWMLYAVYLAELAVGIVYTLLSSVLIGVGMAIGSLLGNIIFTGIIVYLNVVYFNKRAHLFVNE